MATQAVLDIGSSLRDLRVGRGLSLGELARRSNVSKSAVAAWEVGTSRPRGPALVRLLDALEVESRLRARLIHAADPAHARIVLADTALGAPTDVGMVIRAMRYRRGVTQVELARTVGATQATVARWESGDVTPSAETIHALGFALGASAEETVALACAQGTPSGRLSDVPPNPDRPWTMLPVSQSSLYEVVSLGLEAELWPLASRHAQWDPWLGKVIGERSVQLFLQGRLNEAATAARRALRIAPTPEVRLAQTFAFSTLLEISTLQDADPARLASKIEGWAAKLPEGHLKGWMLWEQALRLAATGRADEGVHLTERMADMTANVGYLNTGDYERSILTGLLEVELRAGRTDRAEALVNRLEPIQRQSVQLWRVRIGHLRGEAADEAAMAHAYDAIRWNGDHWYTRQKIAKLERNQARLTTRSRKPQGTARSRLALAT